MELEPNRIPTVIAALAMFALAAWIMLLRPTDRLHRALALFLLARGLMEGLAAVLLSGPAYVSPLLNYVIIAMPFAALNLAIVFHERYRRVPTTDPVRTRFARWGVLVACVVCEGLYLLDHGLWFDDGPGPLSLFLQLTPLSFIGIALVFGLRSAVHWSETTRHAIAIFAVGFAWQPAYDVTFFLFSQLLQGIGATWMDTISVTIELASFSAFVALVVVLGRAGLHRYALATAMPAMTAVPVALYQETGGANGLALAFAMAAVWHLGLVALVGYAVLKFQLFDLDLRVKSAVVNGTVTAGIAMVFFVVSELLEQTVPGEHGVAVGIAIAGAIALALRPIMGFARRLAERVLPGVEDSPAYRDDRSRAVYTAAVEGAYFDHEVTARERRMLENLREELGIDDLQAKVIEAQVTVRARERRLRAADPLDEAEPVPQA